jgi:predicted ATPase
MIAIDEPELGLHPSMMQIIAAHASDAAMRTQVVLTTHSSQFLDALGEYEPTVTITQLQDGATELKTISGSELEYWLKRYALGQLQDSGQLEAMGASHESDISENADEAVSAA